MKPLPNLSSTLKAHSSEGARTFSRRKPWYHKPLREGGRKCYFDLHTVKLLDTWREMVGREDFCQCLGHCVKPWQPPLSVQRRFPTEFISRPGMAFTTLCHTLASVRSCWLLSSPTRLSSSQNALLCSAVCTLQDRVLPGNLPHSFLLRSSAFTTRNPYRQTFWRPLSCPSQT